MIEGDSNDFTIDPYGFPRSTAYFEGSGIQYGMTVLEDMDETGAYIYSFVASGLERTSGRFTPIEEELPEGVPICLLYTSFRSATAGQTGTMKCI